MTNNHDPALTYSSYLKVNELLKLQQPLSAGPEHDELLFIVIHQTYELWFKQLIHEFIAAQRGLESGDTHYSLALLGRIRTIMKICVAQIDILETMTPLHLILSAIVSEHRVDFNLRNFERSRPFLVVATSALQYIFLPQIKAALKI